MMQIESQKLNLNRPSICMLLSLLTLSDTEFDVLDIS